MSVRYSRNRRGDCFVHYKCPACATALRSPLVEIGTEDQCPDCSRPFKVPGEGSIEKIRAQLERELDEKARLQAQKRQQRAERLKKASSFVGDAVSRAFSDTNEEERILVKDKIVIGRSVRKADCLVADPHVGETHCGVFWQENVLNVIDLGSQLGTLLNDELIEPNKVYPLNENDVIRIGPAKFRAEGRSIYVVSNAENAHLACRGLSKDVFKTNGGGKIRILNNVFLDIEPGNFVVLLGPSGSGKSTLLNAMCGRSLASHGHVLFNGEDLYKNFERLKTRLATVPQKDLLHSQLTLESSLKYVADLRLPHDLTTAEKNQRVEKVIREVEMVDHANSAIRTYSGGQLRRAS